MNRRLLLAAAATAVLVAALYLPTLTPGVVGLFHDDALYVLTAQSLSTGEGYALHQLPGAPPQTKYPPFYPLLLAGVWRFWPDFPDNAILFKAAALPFLVLAVLATYRIGRILEARTRWFALAAAALVLINPGVLTFADFTLTELPFLGLLTALLAGWISHDGSKRRTIILALLAGLLPLTRSVGLAAGVAFLLVALLERRRDAAWIAGASFLSFACWELWRTSVDRPTNLLLQYYTDYEVSAAGRLVDDPALAWQIVSDNAAYALGATSWLMGASWLLAPTFWLVLSSVGFASLCPKLRIVQVFTIVYLGMVLLHPFTPYRYLVPLVPVLVLSALRGSALVWQFLYDRVTPIGRRKAVRFGFVAAAVLLVAGNGLVYTMVGSAERRTNLRGWLLFDMGYRFRGFEETFAWIRANTNQDAVIGSLFDPMYALYTGRRAVRPWVHHAETYYYPAAERQPFVGRPSEVGPLLAQLDVTHLTLDPPVGYTEGEAALALLQNLLRQPGVTSRRVFVSSDAQHTVYEVSWPAAWHTLHDAIESRAGRMTGADGPQSVSGVAGESDHATRPVWSAGVDSPSR